MKIKIYLMLIISAALMFFGGQAMALDDWHAEYVPNKVVMIDVDGIITPIVYEKDKLIVKNKYSRVTFSGGKKASLSGTPFVRYDTHPIYNMRPTLYISMCGFGGRACGDQTELEKNLTLEKDFYQYRHFIVYWDNRKEIKRQLESLAGFVGDFLNDRAYPWDVVVIGFSRGGVFAHQLASKLQGHHNINLIHSFLLDPTSAIALGDTYPGADGVRFIANKVFGCLYYDGETWVNHYLSELNLNLSTVGDRNVEGYTNYGRRDFTFSRSGMVHEEIFRVWIDDATQGLDAALNDVKQSKQVSTFYADGATGADVIEVYAPGGLDIDIGAEVNSDHIALWASMSVDGMPVGGLKSTVGTDGSFEFAGATALAQTHYSVNRDRANISFDSVLMSYSSELKYNKASGEVNILGVYDASYSVDAEDVKTFISDVSGLAGGAVSSAGNAVCGILGC